MLGLTLPNQIHHSSFSAPIREIPGLIRLPDYRGSPVVYIIYNAQSGENLYLISLFSWLIPTFLRIRISVRVGWGVCEVMQLEDKAAATSHQPESTDEPVHCSPGREHPLELYMKEEVESSLINILYLCPVPHSQTPSCQAVGP